MRGKLPNKNRENIQVVNDESQQPFGGVDDTEDVTVLVAKKKEPFKGRSNQPDVKDLLNTEEFEEKTEAEWGGQQAGLGLKSLLKRVGIFLVVVTLAAVGLLLYTKSDEESTDAVALSDRELSKDALSATEDEKEALDDLAQLERCLDSYLSAETVDEKIKFCRHPERVRPLLEHYYESHVMAPVSYKWVADLKPLVLDGGSFNFVQAITSDGEPKVDVAANLLLEKLDGSYKVDWETDVCYLPIGWNEFLDKPHAEPLRMRVFAETANVYLGDFSDDEKYHCYKIETRDSEDFIYAYVEQTSETGLKMSELMKLAKAVGDKSPQALILSVSSEKRGGLRNVAVIHEFISPRWTYIEDL
ncbi:hypothetical protein OAI07_01870 [Akkermansiaceae bacterium]|nr:hypothetical protein [Akkermansiaceae bacterium]